MKASKILFLVFVIMMSLWVVNTQPVKPQPSGTIYIRSDGSVDPVGAPIQRVGNVYTFTSNIYDEIVVERDNLVVDGAGYTLQGTGNGMGIDLSERNNTTIRNMEINRFFYGIWLDMSSENSISGNNITNNEVGIDLNQSSNNSIYGNDVMNNWRGTSFWHSSNNSMYGNNIINNDDGVWIGQSSNFNSISENNVTNNDQGIWLDNSSNNTLRGNSMTNNGYNFGVWGESLSDFVNDVDASNTVDGEPVYYWIGMRDVAVPLDAGYVALINCINITVQDLNLIKNRQGVLLAYTTNSTITRNNLASNWHGVRLWYSSNNNISGDNITNNEFGILLINSSRNNVAGNNVVTNNDEGIHIWGSSNNTVAGNTIINNDHGIALWYSSNNRIYKNNIRANNFDGIILLCSAGNKFYGNNFIDNTLQVYIPIPGYANFWNDGYPSGGNYWSDYKERYTNATEIDGTGIWDIPYVIDENNKDNYPLINRYGCIRNLDTNLTYLTIQSAIDAPETLDGHTIFVEAGPYYEHVTINKSISLIGENRSTTIIDANRSGTPVKILSNNVIVSGFTIRNSSTSYPHQNGIHILSNSCVISNNIITNNSYSGILIDGFSNNIIKNNTITNNSIGIVLFFGSPGNNTIRGNTIALNDRYGIYIVYSGGNKIYHNNFTDNRNQTYSTGSGNTWDDGYPSGGNYWSDYEDRYPDAEEINGSGIWDTPYDIYSTTGVEQDNYPIVPEFPTGTSMLLILIMLTVGVVICKRRGSTPIH